ncbi:MAG TPA: hypothetical protein VGM77_11280 [Gemmatimonadales bacterium]
MNTLLFWLAVPLLLTAWAARPDRIPGAAGQLVVAALGLAALWQGAGTLDPQDLHQLAHQSLNDSWFVALTCGTIISGGVLFPDIANWKRLALGVPLVGAALFVALGCWLPLLTGLGIGALPTLVARALRDADIAAAPADGIGRQAALWAAAGVAALLIAPAAVAFLVVLISPWLAWRHRRAPGVAGSLAWPLLGTSALVAWSWLALTIAGSVSVSLYRFAADAPVSTAAGEWLALLLFGWAVALAIPAALSTDRDSVAQLLPLVLAVHLAAAGSAADGVAHWQPALTTAGLLIVVVALAFRRGAVAVLVIALLAATRAGGAALAGAALLAVLPGLWRLGATRRAMATLAGVGAGLSIVVVLRDEVVVALLLAGAIVVAAGCLRGRVATA